MATIEVDRDSLTPTLDMERMRTKMEYEKTEVDLFVEQCSSLYNLILDHIHELTDKEDVVQCALLEEMAISLQRAGARLTDAQPDTEGAVQLRIHTINSAMEQLKLRRSSETHHDGYGKGTAASEFRLWLQNMEKRLKEHETRLRTSTQMTKLLADQQVLQLEIQSEGQAFISRLEHQASRSDTCNEAPSDRRRVFVDSSRKRWHAVYLNSLSLQIRIEERIARYSEAAESDCESEFAAPPPKRARQSADLLDSDSESEDTFPFAASEYESIMDGRTTAVTCESSSSDMDRPASGCVVGTVPMKWDSVQKDIGYSSGENSIHEALNHAGSELEEPERCGMRIDCSPVKSFYKTVPLDTDASDCELTKGRVDRELIPEEKNILSDSMIVNYETHNASVQGSEYDEVLRLLEEENDWDCEASKREWGSTEWRELRNSGRYQRHRHSLGGTTHKTSCDASSEESSDMEGNEGYDQSMDRLLAIGRQPTADKQLSANQLTADTSMCASFMSERQESLTASLKRGRSCRNSSSFMLECCDMDASFCSTRSEMLSTRNRGLRKKIKVRRLPRSMSDGEHMALRVPGSTMSPPRTPLARSTRLLQRLDSALTQVSAESDTAPEQSDAPVFEWDDYRPPAKDESFESGCGQYPGNEMGPGVGGVADSLLSVDDDYNRHFGAAHHTLTRLLHESKANLLIVARTLDAVEDPSVLKDIELIARTNIRQLDTAIEICANGHDEHELESVQQRWVEVLERVSSPVPAILSKFERFTSTLRNLEQACSLQSLNGVSGINCREDAIQALSSMLVVEENLSNDRDELRTLLASSSFKSIMGDHSAEFANISNDFDDAVDKIGVLVSSLRQLNADWLSWSSEQQKMRETMTGIEEALKYGKLDRPTLFRELEYCQERMNSLETVCNQLTMSVASLSDGSDQASVPDLLAEMSIYANALEQLKSKVGVVTSSSAQSPVDATTNAVDVRQRRATPVVSTSTASTQASPPPPPRKSRARLLFLLGALAFAVAAFYITYIHGATLGPHLTYVRGPPPV